MTDARTHAGSIVVPAPAAEVYRVVSDVTRTGEWSPVCVACRWDEGDAPAPGEGPRVGAQFTGRNETAERTWETRCTVVAAEPGRRFAWEVGDGLVRWGYDLAPGPYEGSTTLTEWWEFTPQGLATFAERYGDDAPVQIEQRTRMAHDGIPATLAAIRDVVAR
ncbi:polyketide cyclase/dehydrase/lipid transport protein [Isoptericola jiangsuensis]|uniref:Polyketide cyclase/dehydrase/lipid transport protein n=1 Tax=Isoptericola jiangsuensis TaxID=548579 RepID=A0A2A9EWP9_9MICO|nr:SRPBCC family protein [Isoptericola jiangsuensis]PFG42710.1 polyketide cyclase/dehydrase/lipid transport protein [Isoptericola jiangsuensis]